MGGVQGPAIGLTAQVTPLIPISYMQEMELEAHVNIITVSLQRHYIARSENDLHCCQIVYNHSNNESELAIQR